MDIYEAIGGIWVILTSCIGTALVFGLAGYGGYRLLERMMIGAKWEREAVCELLEEAGRNRREIPGVIQP